MCWKVHNSDCSKCGSGNDIDTVKWGEVVQHYGSIQSQLSDIGNGGSMQITSGSFFEPFQFFIRSIMTQLKPRIKERIQEFLATEFGSTPVIGLHHRHGNGELDDFVDKKTGAPAGRLNKNNTRVIEWMDESVAELAKAYNISDNYRVRCPACHVQSAL